MSKYKEIKTEFKNPFSLIKALADVGAVIETADNPKENAVTLFTNWTSFGGQNQKVAIAVQKANAIRAGLGNFDGIGFQWNGKGYTLIQDHLDQERNEVVRRNIGKLTQRYSYHEVKRQAKMNGYTTQEIQQEDGSIRLVLSRR